MTGLERRCRWLLRAYPAWYRAARGDEVLATLLEAAEQGGAWPTWREAGALALGGLRVRALQYLRLSTSANLRLSVMLGLATSIGLLGSGSAGWPWLPVYANSPDVLGGGGWFSGGWAAVPYNDFWPIGVAFALTVCAPAAAWIGRRAVAVSLLLAAAAAVPFAEAWASGIGGGPVWLQGVLGVSLPLCLLFVTLAVVTALGQGRPPRAWLWWYALPPAWILAERMAGMMPFTVAQVLIGLPLLPAFVLGAIAWVVVDARPAIALAVLLTVLGFTGAAGGVDPGFGRQADLRAAALNLTAGLVLATPALLRMRRQAVL